MMACSKLPVSDADSSGSLLQTDSRSNIAKVAGQKKSKPFKAFAENVIHGMGILTKACSTQLTKMAI